MNFFHYKYIADARHEDAHFYHRRARYNIIEQEHFPRRNAHRRLITGCRDQRCNADS